MKIARVFPRRTNATPDDPLAFVGMPDLFTPDWFDEVRISVAFTYDLPRAEQLANVWEKRTNKLLIGGPGTGMKGGEFTPGVYLKKGYVITSRGCPNSCWYCTVHDREGDIRELKIHAGWNVLDDNLLACSKRHITNVFKMLMKVKKVLHKRIEFTGGLEAKRLESWHIDWLLRIKPKQMFFAYDDSEDFHFLYYHAGKMLRDAGFTNNQMRCYVLIGYQNDTFEKSEKRLRQTISAGFTPMAMLYRDENGVYNKDWTKFQKEWARPAIMRAKGLI